MALIAAAHIVPPDMVPLIFPIVLQRTSHSKEFIRKKALICLEQLILKHKDSQDDLQSLLGPCEAKFRLALTDKDPGVVMTSIQVMKTVVGLKQVGNLGFKMQTKIIIIILQATQEVNDGSSKDLVDALVCVQEQAVNGRLPRQDFDHGE